MKILSVTSGKGGAGKTSLVCNMAASLAKLGKRVLVFDGDMGMANVDIFFGVHPQRTLQDAVNGRPLKDCLTPVAQNIDLLAGGSGLQQLCNLNAFQRREILTNIGDLNFSFDYLLIDTSPGLHDHVLHLNSVADERLVVLTSDPSSFTDAYALIKVLNQKHKIQNFSIVCNQVTDEKAGAQLYLRFADVAQQFLPIRLNYKKTVPFDPQMKLSNQLQRLIVRQDAKSASSQAIMSMCAEIVSQNQMVGSTAESAKGFDTIFRPASGHA
jgi:flagellar biosynthesis protein FlhG